MISQPVAQAVTEAARLLPADGGGEERVEQAWPTGSMSKASVGAGVGAVVGTPVGDAVVGAKVGDVDGEGVGPGEGDEVGAGVGVEVGVSVGAPVGDGTGQLAATIELRPVVEPTTETRLVLVRQHSLPVVVVKQVLGAMNVKASQVGDALHNAAQSLAEANVPLCAAVAPQALPAKIRYSGVGLGVGAPVGAGVGVPVGASVGCAVGEPVGHTNPTDTPSTAPRLTGASPWLQHCRPVDSRQVVVEPMKVNAVQLGSARQMAAQASASDTVVPTTGVD